MARELAADIQQGGGLITAQDLAEYEVKERQPIRERIADMKSSARLRQVPAASPCLRL